MKLARRFSRVPTLVWVLSCVVVGAATEVRAQTGGLRVEVVDAEGPLPGARVTLSNALGYLKTATELTDASGLARFPVLRAGTGYAIEVSIDGYQPTSQDGIRIPIGETVTLRIGLVRDLVETVRVAARRGGLDLDDTTAATTFSDAFIQDLPIPGRSYQNLFTLAPGVQDDDGDGNVTVHGSRDRDFKPIVGGVSMVDPLTGQLFVDVNLNSIEEMRVITTGAGAKYGRAQGGFATIIQKQGSNTLEGLAELYYNSSDLDGDGATSSRPEFQADFENFRPGFQVSGPVLRDRLWYRVTSNLERLETPVNSGSRVDVQNVERTVSQGQLTWQVSPRNKLAFAVDLQDYEGDNIGISSLVRPDSTYRQTTDYTGYRLQWTAPFSPKVLVDTTFAYQDYGLTSGPSRPGSINDCIPDARTAGLQGGYCTDAVRQRVSGPPPLDYRDARQRFTLNTEATVFGGRFLGTTHQLNLGMVIENERYQRSATRRPSLSIVQRNDGPVEGFGGGEVLTAASVPVPRSWSNTLTATAWTVYLEDQIRIRSNLQLTVGVNYTREQTRSEGFSVIDPDAEFEAYASEVYDDLYANGFILSDEAVDTGLAAARYFTAYPRYQDLIPGLKNAICGDETGDCVGNFTLTSGPSWRGIAENFQGFDNIVLTNDNLAPNVALAWDPFSNGKNQIKVTAARKFNNVPLVVPLSELAPADVNVVVLCEEGDCSSVRAGGPASNQIVPDVSVIDRELATPYQDEWTVAFERELATELQLRLEYVNRRYKRQLQDVDVNHVAADFGSCVVRTGEEDDPPEGFYVFPVRPEPYGGDGKIDDCVGRVEIPIGTPGEPEPGEGGGGLGAIPALPQVPDGYPDLYTQNPAWGDIYRIGNVNRAKYEAVTLALDRRQYRGWQMTASYRWSIARGNGEDFDQAFGDDRSIVDDEVGFQSNDRRHEVKFAATTVTPWGFRFGAILTWQSGLPYSIQNSQFSTDALPPVLVGAGFPVGRTRIRFPTGERNSERNRSVWNLDLNVTREVRLGKRANLQLSLEVFNALNDGTYVVYNPDLRYGRQLDGVNDARRRFGRQFQVGAKLTF